MKITKRPKNIKQEWYVINAENMVLGRLATRIANILTGKKKAYYSHDVPCGDFVVVINAGKIRLTANKLKTKIYYWHTGYPGGLKSKTAEEMMKKKPEFPLIHAVTGMLPKNKLRAIYLKNFKVYAGAEHPHRAQQPILMDPKTGVLMPEKKEEKKETPEDKKKPTGTEKKEEKKEAAGKEKK